MRNFYFKLLVTTSIFGGCSQEHVDPTPGLWQGDRLETRHTGVIAGDDDRMLFVEQIELLHTGHLQHRLVRDPGLIAIGDRIGQTCLLPEVRRRNLHDAATRV